MFPLRANTGVLLLLLPPSAERREGSRQRERRVRGAEAVEWHRDDGDVKVCGDRTLRGYKYPRPQSTASVCVSRAGMNVTENYLNKVKTEVTAASVRPHEQ